MSGENCVQIENGYPGQKPGHFESRSLHSLIKVFFYSSTFSIWIIYTQRLLFYLLQFTIWSQILRRFKNSKQNSGKSTYSTGELYLNIKCLWWSSFSSVYLDEGKVGYGSSSPWICCCKKMWKCSKKNEKHPFDVDVSNLVRNTCLNVNLLRTIATDFLSMHQWHEC